MPKLTIALVIAVVVWIAWCVLVITELVPVIGRHVTMWPWLMSYVLCLTPVVVLGIITVARLRASK